MSQIQLIKIFVVLVVALALHEAYALTGSRSVLLSGANKSYIGPGDLVSGAKAFISCGRGYNSAYAKTNGKTCNIRRASDNTAMDMTLLASGVVNVAAAISFCASTTCFLTQGYDQTSNGNNVLNSTNGNQMAINLSGLNSLPTITFTGASTQCYAASSTLSTITQPWTEETVSERTGSGTTWITGGAGQWNIGYNAAANTAEFYAGTVVTNSASDNAFHLLMMVASGASSFTGIDGTGSTVNVGTNSISSNNMQIGGAFNLSICNSAVPYTGSFAEIGLWPSGFSSAQQVSMCHATRTFWGTAGTC